MTTGAETQFWQKVLICEHALTARAAGKAHAQLYTVCRVCCWPWTRAQTGRGYGKTTYDFISGREHGSHRVAWRLAHGGQSFPTDSEICHTCDNPSCCNPAHLVAATHQANMSDAAEKGRKAKAAHGGARPRKLTAAQVEAIRGQAARGSSFRLIASEFAVSHVMVWLIVHRKAWDDATRTPSQLHHVLARHPRP